MKRLDARWALSAPLWIAGATLAATGFVAVLFAEQSTRIWLPTAIGIVLGLLLARYCPRLPAVFLDFLRVHKRLRLVAVVLACLAFLQTARQSAFQADSGVRIGRSLPTDTTDHQCLAAYIRGAEVSLGGLGPIYGEAPYEPGSAIPTRIEGMAPYLGDPFVYPPQALVLPRLGIALTEHYGVLRACWWALSGLGFGAIALLVARRVRGDGAWVAWLLVPAVWISIPVAYNMEYGQVHLLTLAVAMAAMLAFDRGRDELGGGLLAIAIGWKIFPGILLLYLAAQRRWRAVVSTIVASAALVAIAMVVMGWGAFDEFITSHLPSLMSGEAFNRYYDWEEVTAQFSLAGHARLAGIGAGASRIIGAGYTLAALLLTVVAGSRNRGGSPLVWLAILNLGAMQSPFAPASYLAAGIVWLFSFWVAEHWSRPHLAWGGIGLWFFVQIAPFFASIPVLWSLPRVHAPAAFVATLIAVALCVHSCVSDQSEVGHS